MILVIAYGNRLREDDGAGHLLAQALEQEWTDLGAPVRRLAVHQLTPELAMDLLAPGVSAAVFVDACVAPSPAHTEVSVQRVSCADTASGSLGHSATPGQVLTLVHLLMEQSAPAARVPPAWLVTVPGHRFGYAEAISSKAKAAIKAALRHESSALRALIATVSSSTPVYQNQQDCAIDVGS